MLDGLVQRIFDENFSVDLYIEPKTQGVFQFWKILVLFHDMMSTVPSLTDALIKKTRTIDTSSRQSKKQKLSVVHRSFTKRAEQEQKRRTNDRSIETSVQAYRLRTSQVIMSRQRNNASALHALTNAYVMQHGGDPIPPPALPEIPNIPTITVLHPGWLVHHRWHNCGSHEEIVIFWIQRIHRSVAEESLVCRTVELLDYLVLP